MSTDDGRPTLEDRQAAYASWRKQLHDRVEANRALTAEPEAPAPVPDDTWSPERLFEESRRLADTG